MVVGNEVKLTGGLAIANTAVDALKLQTNGRKFSSLCGHDSTFTALVSALDIKEYDLPDAISQKAPIGGKMVFE